MGASLILVAERVTTPYPQNKNKNNCNLIGCRAPTPHNFPQAPPSPDRCLPLLSRQTIAKYPPRNTVGQFIPDTMNSVIQKKYPFLRGRKAEGIVHDGKNLCRIRNCEIAAEQVPKSPHVALTLHLSDRTAAISVPFP